MSRSYVVILLVIAGFNIQISGRKTLTDINYHPRRRTSVFTKDAPDKKAKARLPATLSLAREWVSAFDVELASGCKAPGLSCKNEPG